MPFQFLDQLLLYPFYQFLHGSSLDPALVLLNNGVIAILDHMFGPTSIEKFRNECPFRSMLNNIGKELAVLFLGPFVAIDLRTKMVVPLLSALLRTSEVQLF